uniref:Zinc finger HIT-type containing 1 n=1 Tax=Podarcis muralis TaxID=64176 RepID=A0A670J7D5_PODMU
MVEKKISARSQDPSQRRILDRATRQRRLNRQLEALENDNFQDDPHANMPQLVKRLPQFDDDAETEPERERRTQLPDSVCAPFQPAPAPLLHRLRLPVKLHMCIMWNPVLLRQVSGDAPGNSVSEVDRLRCVLRNCRVLPVEGAFVWRTCFLRMGWARSCSSL